jgi:hypothetical protein
VATDTYRLGFGSCLNAADSDAFSRIQQVGVDALYLAGDLWYDDHSPVAESDHQTHWVAKLGAPKLSALIASLPAQPNKLAVGWSDHDFGFTPNATAGSITDVANAGYRSQFPGLPLAAVGIYRTWTRGRVRFILLDERSFKSPLGAADGASKTMLGATQRAWLKGLVASNTYPLIVLLGDTPWVGTATAGDDSWKGYAWERDDLRVAFQASPAKIVRLNGDMHCLATGVDQFGITRVWQAAPFSNTTKVKANGEGYTQTWPHNTDEGPTAQQFAVVTFEDTGATISATYRGYTVGQATPALSATLIVQTPPDADPGPPPTDPGVPGGGDYVTRQEYDDLRAFANSQDSRVDALETWKTLVDSRLSALEAKTGTGTGSDPGTTDPGNDTSTAAVTQNWGAPTVSETFADLTAWTRIDGAGEGGFGTRESGQVTVANNELTILGLAGTPKTGRAEHKTKQRYGRWEFRAKSVYTGQPTTPGTLTGGYSPVIALVPDVGSAAAGQGEYDVQKQGEPGEQTARAFLRIPTSNGDGSQVITVAGKTVDLRQYHNFAIDWQPTGVKLYVDGVLWATHSGGASGAKLNVQDMQSAHLVVELAADAASGMVASTLQVDWLRVYPKDSAGTGGGGGTGTVTLSPPRTLTGSINSSRVCTLNWLKESIGTATQYEVHSGPSPDALTLKTTVDAPTLQRVSGSLQAQTIYYAVRAKDAAGKFSRFSNQVKVVVTSSGGTVTAGLAEGWDAGSGGQEPDDPGEEPTTGGGSSQVGSGGAPSPIVNPADLFRTADGKVKWYLTTPEWDPSDNTKTWNINMGGSPDLATFKRDTNAKRAFKLNASKSGVIMSADYEGSHTPNSANTRMELRERDGANANIGWSTRSGTHRLTSITQCDRLDGNHCVMAQIHGGQEANDDLTVYRLEGTTLWATNGDEPHGHVIDSNYQLGTPVLMSFDVNSSGSCKFRYKKFATVEEALAYDLSLTWALPIDWTLQLPVDSKSYFKDGCYNQRKGAAGSYSQVTLYKTIPTHA